MKKYKNLKVGIRDTYNYRANRRYRAYARYHIKKEQQEGWGCKGDPTIQALEEALYNLEEDLYN